MQKTLIFRESAACPNSAVTSGPFYDNLEDYAASHILFDGDCATVGHYWSGLRAQTNQAIVIDLSCTQVITQVSLRNHFEGSRNWGTKEFTVEVSQRGGDSWVEALGTTQLPDENDLMDGCKVPLRSFPLASPATGRYVRFTAVSYYQEGPNLQYLQLHTQPPVG